MILSVQWGSICYDGTDLHMSGHSVNSFKEKNDENTTLQHCSLKTLILKAEVRFLNCSYCLKDFFPNDYSYFQGR